MLKLYRKFKEWLNPPPEPEKIKPSVYKDSFIICTNYHIVATTNRDIYKYDSNYSTAFDYLEHQPVATKGQTDDPVCYCGAPWFSIFGSKLMMKPVTKIKVDNEDDKT